jgi:hypothetical protein
VKVRSAVVMNGICFSVLSWMALGSFARTQDYASSCLWPYNHEGQKKPDGITLKSMRAGVMTSTSDHRQTRGLLTLPTCDHN